MKKESKIGLILLGVVLIMNRFLNIHSFISGVLMGFSLLYLLIGIMPNKAYVKIKELKNTVKN